MRFRGIGCTFATALAIGLTGCSVHPLPEDVSRATTADIVARIRCEAKEGLQRFRPDQMNHVNLIVANTTIGFEFDFDIEEDNSPSGGQLVFKRPDGSFTLTVDGGVQSEDGTKDRARTNRRIFSILEGLRELRGAACEGIDTKRANPIHPITGATGMAELVRTYVELEMLTDVARGSDGTVFSDELRFTTEFNAGIKADWSLNTPVGSLTLKQASLTGTASRKDVHSVTVALARDKEDVDPPERGARKNERTKPETVTKVRFPNAQAEKVQAEEVATRKGYKGPRPRVIRSPGLQRTFVQRDLDARNRVLLELQGRRNRKEDRKVVERVLGKPLP